MAIEVKSDEWTGQKSGEPDAPPAGAPQVCGEFHDRDKLDEALSRLEGSLFQRADLSVRYPGQEEQKLESPKEEPTREDDARNLRTLGTGTAMAATGMAAAGVVVATGGAALPAVAAAAAGMAGAGAVGEGIGQAAAPSGNAPMHQAAETSGVVLMAHAENDEKRAKAEEIMRACGAARVWTVPRAAAA
jgi:hypothetical protein